MLTLVDSFGDLERGGYRRPSPASIDPSVPESAQREESNN